MKSLPNRFPLPFLILAMLALLAALWAGLMRLGWRVIADYANWHILRM